MIEEGWARAERVLCVRLDTMGDVLMTTPAIRALKEPFPGRHITLLTSEPGARIAALVPEIDDIIVYDAPWMKATAPRPNSLPEYAMADFLRGQGFHAAVIFTVYSQNPLPSAFLCYLADIPLRLAHCHENPYQLLTDWVPDPEPGKVFRHEVRRQLDLVARAGCRTVDEHLSISVPPEDLRTIKQVLSRAGIDVLRPWVIVHPGVTSPSRQYSAEGFARVARSLALDLGWQLVFTGIEGEHELVEGIRAAAGAHSVSFAGRLSLGELAALISIAPLLVSNNTGPVHVAAALGTPVVDIYALTNPQHTPWMVPNRVLFHDVPCKYCYKSVCPEVHHNCLRLVTPESVVRAARELLDGSTPSSSTARGSGELTPQGRGKG